MKYVIKELKERCEREFDCKFMLGWLNDDKAKECYLKPLYRPQLFLPSEYPEVVAIKMYYCHKHFMKGTPRKYLNTCDGLLTLDAIVGEMYKVKRKNEC